MIIIFDTPALVFRLRRLISRHKSRIVIDIPAYIYIFPKITHYDSYLIASNCFYYDNQPPAASRRRNHPKFQDELQENATRVNNEANRVERKTHN